MKHGSEKRQKNLEPERMISKGVEYEKNRTPKNSKK